MQETKKFDNWIGFLSISVVIVIVCIFVLTMSNAHLAKGTYSTDACGGCRDGYVCQETVDQDCIMSCGAGACLDTSDCIRHNCVKDSTTYLCYCYMSSADCMWATSRPSILWSESSDTSKCSDNSPSTVSPTATPKPTATSSKCSDYDTSDTCPSWCDWDRVKLECHDKGGSTVQCDGVNSFADPTACRAKASDKTVCPNGFDGCGFKDETTGCYSYTCKDPGTDNCRDYDRCISVASDNCGTLTPVCEDSDKDGCYTYYCTGTSGSNVKTVTLKIAEGTSGNGSFTVDTGTNKIKTFSPTINCGTWSTKPCANGNCTTGASAQDAAYSGLAVGVTYTGPSVLYCKAGTSIHPGGPDTPTQTPKTTAPKTTAPKTTPTPTSTPSNPQTGMTGVIMAWLVGAAAIVYSVWYFKKSSLM